MTPTATSVAKGDAVALTQALTRIDSRNPTLTSEAPGEREVAETLARILDDWGFSVDLTEAATGRPNLVARIGPADTPALMFAGHLDTVGVEGMTHPPFDAFISDGRIHGRGTADMKAGVAAMCVAAWRAAEAAGSAGGAGGAGAAGVGHRTEPRRQIIVAAVVDEEYESLGMRALLASGTTAECAIVTEPTRLSICPAHKGFVWLDLEFTGRAAHGSRHDIGVDAIRHAGLVLAELDELDANLQTRRTHPLLGRPSLHASLIEGGIGMSTYPARCRLSVERRTLPGETPADAMREISEACAKVKRRKPELDARITLNTAQSPSDVPRDAVIVSRLERALADEGLPRLVEGLSAWTDAALLNEAGIPAICFGPGDIGLAHAAEESVPIDEITRATAVLERVARDWLLETA